MIDGLGPYPAMKDSGVPWLGEVPAHWEVRPIDGLGALFKGKGGNKSDEVSAGIPCVRYGDLYTTHQFFITTSKACVSNQRADAYTPIQYGDVLFAASGETIEDIGRSAVNLIEGDARCGGDVLVLRPEVDEVVPRYLGYAADSPASRHQKACMGRGFTVVHIYGSELKRLALPLPPLPEQAAIVRFLDHADRRIWRCIRARQKLIKLLEEQKQAIIHRAVSCGLDPNLRLKPSGVEWMGDMPDHWEVRRLHQITDPKRPVMYGIVLPGPDVDEGVYIVKGGNCEPGRLRPELLSRTTFQIESRYARSRLRANDIVFAIRGGVGAAELVPPELAGANLTQDAARIAAGGSIDSGWLLNAVSAPIFREHVKSQVVGATVRGINIRSLKRIELVVPPYAEQKRIAEHIADVTGDISAALDRARQEIALLREYRTRMIADVVTGKLDVRETAARLSNEVDPIDEADVLSDAEDATSDDLDAVPEETEA